MPPKAKYALASIEAAHLHVTTKFGQENAEALLVAADCGAMVAVVLGRMHMLEPLLLSLPDDKRMKEALVYPTKLEKDGTGRSTKVRTPFIPLLSHLFSSEGAPRRDVRARLESLAPCYSEFAETIAMFGVLSSMANQLHDFYAKHPERQDLFRQLKNPKQLMTAYVLEEARNKGIADNVNATDLAAFAIVIDIEMANPSTKAMGDKWQEIRKAADLAKERLSHLPRVAFSQTTIKLKAELPPNSVRAFMRVLAGIGG